MPLAVETFLDSAEFRGMVREAAERQNRDRPLLYDAWVPDRPATDREILGEYNTVVRAADIITDDAEAVVYRGGRITASTMTIPKIKVGQLMTEEMIEQVDRISRNLGTGADRAELVDWKRRTADEVTLGIRQTRNFMKCGMLRDGFAYNRFGVQIASTWGMPATQKITSLVAWDQHGTATPVTDILTAKRQASLKGETLNRMTLSNTAFFHMVQTTEFQARIGGVVQFALPAGAFSPQDTPQMERFAVQILGLKEIVFDDATFDREEPDGTATPIRYLPVPEVILTNTADDGNDQAWNFGNGLVTESRFQGSNGPGARMADPQRGPLGYITWPTDLNPPNVTFWGVQRGFPRKRRKAASAVIITGAYAA